MRLRLSPVAIATAAAFAHRFFAVRSMARNCRALVAAAALYLAGKVEETPARAREVLTAVDALVPLLRPPAPSTRSPEGGGEGAAEAPPRPPRPPPLAADEGTMLSAVDALMTAERALLYSLGFRLDVEHPFRTALSLAKEHGDSATVAGGASPSPSSSAAAAAAAGSTASARAAHPAPPAPPLPGPGAKALAQTAWNLLADSLRTRLCLTHRPQAVGAAAFLLALRLHGADVAAAAAGPAAASATSAPAASPLPPPSAPSGGGQKGPAPAAPAAAPAAAVAAPPSSASSLPPRWWWEGVGATPAEIGSAADELLKVYEEGGGGTAAEEEGGRGGGLDGGRGGEPLL